MRTICTNVYQFNELNKQAKQNAIENMYDINVNYSWWEYTYEDAANAGLKLTSFNIDRGNYCNGKFINSAQDCAQLIIKNHGKECSTYVTASDFIQELTKLTDQDEDKIEELEEQFLKDILEDYKKILSAEYEYQTSKEAIIETIEANEYEFTEEGEPS